MNELHSQGEIIDNRYQIVTLLGQGGMGSTYSAVDLNNHQRVALKVVSLINTKDWKILELFEREAQVLKNINHPFIPNYLDYFSVDTPTDKKFYLIQELVEGESLTQLIERGKTFSEEEVKDIASQILEILTYIHGLNSPIIHRDIKPDNIICRQDGKVYLVDFGAVKAVYHQTIIGHNTMIGTYGYIPLEQFEGKSYYTSDLYSLGCTLIYILTHRSPADLPQKRMKIDFKSYVSISEDFGNWLDKIIEPEAVNRFQSAQQALTELDFSQIYKQKSLKGSKVKIERNQNEFIIDIPSYKNKYSVNSTYHSPGCLFIFLVISLFLFLATISISVILTTLLFLLLLIMIRRLEWIFTGSFNLKITQNHFKAQQKKIFTNKLLEGHPQDLQLIPFYREYNCPIRYKKKQINIDPTNFSLTEIEKQWIFDEIISFMEEQDWYSENNLSKSKIEKFFNNNLKEV